MNESSAPTFHSQFGEDRILARIFRRQTRGTCVEVGANDGVHGSTTLHFERAGWNCILIEPNPALCAEIRARRTARVFACAASSSSAMLTLHIVEGAWQAHAMSTVSDDSDSHERIRELGFNSRPVQVPARPLDDMLAEAQLKGPIDFVTIDVEGHELDVLRGFSFARWQPTIVIVEDNSNGLDLAPRDHLTRHGYVKFRRTGVNDWYARRSDRALVNTASRLRLAAGLLATRARQRLRRYPWAVFLWRRLRALRHPLRAS